MREIINKCEETVKVAKRLQAKLDALKWRKKQLEASKEYVKINGLVYQQDYRYSSLSIEKITLSDKEQHDYNEFIDKCIAGVEEDIQFAQVEIHNFEMQN